MLLAPSPRSFESLRVVMAIGTSWAFSERLRAVTTISSSPPSDDCCAAARSAATKLQANRIPRVREPLIMRPPTLADPPLKLFVAGAMGYRSNERWPSESGADVNASALSALLLDLYRYSRELTLAEFQGRALERLRCDLGFDTAWWGVAHTSHDIHSSFPFGLPADYANFYLAHVSDTDTLAEAGLSRLGHTVRSGPRTSRLHRASTS